MLVMGLSVLVHLPAVSAGFTYDDHDFVRNNASVTSVSSALGAWLRPFPPEQPARGLYRPLTALSYALDHAVAGPEPLAFHLGNLLWYALSCLLVFQVSRHVLDSIPLGLLAALVFALHPVHCEAVDSVSGRSELLALTFGLATALSFLHRAPLVALATYACALLSKETAIMTLGVLGVLVALGAVEHGRSWSALVRAWLRLWPWCLVTLAYLGLRLLALDGHLGPRRTYVGEAPFVTRIWTFGRVLLEYLRLLVAPVELHPDAYYQRRVGVQHAASAEGSLGLLAFVLLLALLLALAHRLARQADKRVAGLCLGLASFLLFLVPVSHLVPFGAVMAERFLFAPSFGFALALAGAAGLAWPVLRSRATRIGASVLAAASLLGLGVRSHARAADWHDDVTLWSPTVRFLPDDYRVHNSIGRGYVERGDIARAIPWLERSLALKPDHGPTLNNLGYTQRQRGELALAEATFRRLVSLEPDHAIGWHNLAALAATRGDLGGAERLYLKVLRINPNYAPAERELAGVRALRARARRAVERLGPAEAQSDPTRLRELGNACRALGDRACSEAVEARLRASSK